MKKIVLTLICMCFLAICYSQSDTLYTTKRQKITCKITEIGEDAIKYTRAESPDGPVYIISKSSILKYTLATGFTEVIMPDEMSIEHEHAEILQNRQVIKLHPFSFSHNQISLAYEKVIKVGMNLDIEAGYINNSITQQPLINANDNLFRYNYYNGYGPYYYAYNSPKVFYSGGYIKPGVKFFLGQDYSIKGLKYAHPLKGRYIKLEFAASFLNFKNVKRVEMTPSSNPNFAPTTTTITTNISSFAYGGFISYGRQFILGNMFTLEYYVSAGYTAQSGSYSNSNFLKTNTNQYIYDATKGIPDYHGFFRAANGLSAALGLRIGYILPDKKTKQEAKLKQN